MHTTKRINEATELTEALKQALDTSQQCQKELSAVLNVSEAIFKYREFNDAARVIFDSCKKLIGATSGYIALTAENGTTNDLLFLDSGEAVCTVDPELQMPIRGMRGKVYGSGQTVYTNDFSKSEWVKYLPAGHLSLDSALFAPLILDGMVVGLLGLANKPGGFTENDASLASHFAEFVSFALLNSRTFKSLEDSEENFRSVAQNAGDAIISNNISGNITFWNHAAETMFGYTASEILGKATTQLMPERLRQAHQEGIQRLVATGISVIIGKKIETVGLNKDGKEFPIEMSLAKCQTRYGMFITAVLRDLTDRKLMEERFRTVIATSMDGFCITDVHGRFLEVNDAYSKMIGYSSEELLKMRVDDVEEAEDPKEIAKHIEKLIQTKNERFESVHRHKDGSTVAVEISVHYLQEHGGRCMVFLRDISSRRKAEEAIRDSHDRLELMVQERTADLETANAALRLDIAERKKTEEALQQSESRSQLLADILERASQPFGIGFPDGRLGIINSAFCELTGYNEQELRSMDWAVELTPEEWREQETQILAELQRTGKPVRYEKEYIRKDGSRVPIELFVHQAVGAEGSVMYYYSFITDITERKIAEKEHLKLEQQYRQAQKMEAVGRLAGGVAHDFNNMLSIILGYADLALMKLNPADPLYRDINEIQKAGFRSTDIIRQLMAFARKQEILPKVLDANAIISQSEKMLRRLLGEDIDFRFIPKADLCMMYMDPSQLDQILVNLAVNSRDAIAGVGHMIVETANVVLDRIFCSKHHAIMPGEYVLLTFSDNGCGMDKETLVNIFEPFFTTKGEGQGTGLGLATVYGIVKQNKGLIEVESEPAQGTVFKIYFPRFTKKAEKSEETMSGGPLRGVETILVVEDEESILKLCQIGLEAYGYKVITANTPGEAILLAKKYEGDIHLLITDVVMPTMNGKELKEQITAMKPGIRVIFMSGYTADIISHKGVLAEGAMFIQKPFLPQDLARKVRNLLHPS